MKNHNQKTAWPWIFVSALIIACDQLTKYLILQHLTEQSAIRIFPFLNFILRFNAGASFSFLGNASGWQIYLLAGISLVVSVVLIVWLTRLPRDEWWTSLPISLVLGGALGNLIDRMHFGYVTDFIDFHVRNWHFATFNVADSAVSVGATWLVLLFLYEIYSGRH